MGRRLFFGSILAGLAGWLLAHRQPVRPPSHSFILTPDEMIRLANGETVEYSRQGEPVIALVPKRRILAYELEQGCTISSIGKGR